MKDQERRGVQNNIRTNITLPIFIDLPTLYDEFLFERGEFVPSHFVSTHPTDAAIRCNV